MFCTTCGTQLAPDAKFCKRCGAKAAAPQQPAPNQAPAETASAAPQEPTVVFEPVGPAPSPEAAGQDLPASPVSEPDEPTRIIPLAPEPTSTPVQRETFQPDRSLPPNPDLDRRPTTPPPQPTPAPAPAQPAPRKAKKWPFVLCLTLCLCLVIAGVIFVVWQRHSHQTEIQELEQRLDESETARNTAEDAAEQARQEAEQAWQTAEDIASTVEQPSTQQTEDDGDWEDACEHTFEQYIYGLTDAINQGDFSLVSHVFVPGSEIYTMQQSLVDNLCAKGTQESVIRFDAEFYQTDSTHAVAESDEYIGVTQADGSYDEVHQQFYYYFQQQDDGSWLLYNMERMD